MKKIFAYVAMLSMAMMSVFSSCEPVGPDNGEDPGGSVVVGDALGTVILSCEEGSSVDAVFTAKSSWVVSNTNTWFKVTPNSGQPGNNTLTVSASKPNTDILERVKSFTIIDGAEKKNFFVVQRGIITTSISENDIFALTGDTQVVIPVSGTYPFNEIKVTTDAEWIKFSSIQQTSDSTLLADQKTMSNFVEGDIIMEVVEQNDESASSREAVLNIEAGSQKFSITVIQQSSQEAVADFSKDFYRMSVIQKLTGTWCGYCPIMAAFIDEAQKTLPDRSIVISTYIKSGASGEFQSPDLNKILGHFGYGTEDYNSGVPYEYFNGYSENMSVSSKLFVDLCQEAIDAYPSNVGIAGYSKLSKDKTTISLNMSFAAKAEKDYRVVVSILENGLEASQADYNDVINTYFGQDAQHFIHDHVLISMPTKDFDLGGEVLGLTPNTVVNKTFDIVVPSSVQNVNNVQLLVYVTVPGGPLVQGVKDARYTDFGWYVDNAVLIPVNGFADFKYEE